MCMHGCQCCCQTWLCICSRAASVVSKSCAVLRAGMAAARPPSIARFPKRVLLRSDGAATSLCAEKIVDASSRLSLGAVQLCSHLCVLSYRVRLNGSSTRPARFRSSFGTAIMRSTALNAVYMTHRTSVSKHWLSRHVPGALLRHRLSRYEGQIYAPFDGLGHVCNDTRKRGKGHVDSYDTRPPRPCVVEIVKTWITGRFPSLTFNLEALFVR